MFKSVDPLLYFAGALFVSVSIGFHVASISIGCMVFGAFCIFGSFLNYV